MGESSRKVVGPVAIFIDSTLIVRSGWPGAALRPIGIMATPLGLRSQSWGYADQIEVKADGAPRVSPSPP